ncbi:MAG TPA: hypothetical protein VJ826_15445 [Candidatus Polarisedimenticolaceae bacterium]|nr:hypothetical protein [Candidatus Polarisedimenticolaceae bacterium]
MRTLAIGIALLALSVPPAAHAANLTCRGLGKDVQWAERLAPSDARLAITTENGKMTLLLTDDEVAYQLSDRTFRHVQRKLRKARDEQDHWLGSAIVTAVTGTVRDVLDHSFVCDLSDLRDATYEDGRLVLTGRRGEVIFGDDDDGDGMEGFSPHDARRFVREFHRMKARQR